MSTLTYQVGDVVPWRFVPGLVVASFFASLLGTILTVELLHRKRLGKTLISRLQLLSCAAAMGLIGIWCMHFIGNRSIELGDGSPELQLTYSPGFTVLSCILPVVGLSLAFYIAELSIRSVLMRRLLDLLTGFIAGMSIVGMHYIGNLGTSNYRMIYPPRFIIASCIIAIGDCIVALMLFFYFKEQWIGVFWKRLGCAILLAIAVCGMHYTASIGCTYQLTSLDGANLSRNTAVIVAGVLCFAAAVACLFIIVWSNVRQQRLADRAQQVNLACAFFDKDGNILVTNDGTLPSQKVAQRFYLQRFDDDLNTSHPVFHWIWKVSSDWSVVSDLIPKMRRHLRQFEFQHGQVSRRGSTATTAYDEESYNDQTTLFRESFCVAALDLAERMRISLPKLGTLYDRVTGTGVTDLLVPRKVMSDSASYTSSMHGTVEKGQILFFTKVLTTDEADHFVGQGYRFAPPVRVEGMVAKTMQLPIQSVAAHIKDLREFSEGASVKVDLKHGTYLTCFAALGRISKSFDVLVTRANQGSLPDVQLAAQHLTASQINFLKQYDGSSAGNMVADLKQKRARGQGVDEAQRGFVLALITSLSSLSHQISEEWFNDLIFNAKPICSRYGTGDETTMIFGLTKLLDIHNGIIHHPERLSFVPLDFFRVRAAFGPGSPERTKFRSAVHAEFAPLAARPIISTPPGEKTPTRRSSSTRFHDLVRRLAPSNPEEEDATTLVHHDNDFDSGRVSPNSNKLHFESMPTSPVKQTWGGILATTDTVIITGTTDIQGNLEMKTLSPTVVATVIKDTKVDQGKSFADELYEQAKRRGTATVVSQRAMSSSQELPK